jgi:hypothetical protein
MVLGTVRMGRLRAARRHRTPLLCWKSFAMRQSASANTFGQAGDNARRRFAHAAQRPFCSLHLIITPQAHSAATTVSVRSKASKAPTNWIVAHQHEVNPYFTGLITEGWVLIEFAGRASSSRRVKCRRAQLWRNQFAKTSSLQIPFVRLGQGNLIFWLQRST